MQPDRDAVQDLDRALLRRRTLSAVVTLVALAAVAAGSVVGAFASAHDDRADAQQTSVAVGGR